MCGIAGIVTFEGICPPGSATTVESMCRELAHRGPDGGSVKDLSSAILGHRRLAVVDLSDCANQPMTNETGNVWVVFNGEIYNHNDLRAELSSKGHTFKSRSDTETLVHGYEEWGLRSLVPRLRGMFAFALWDCRNKLLFLVRDRAGVKPLYYQLHGSSVSFCSELRPLLGKSAVLPSDISKASLDFFLSFGNVPPDKSILHSIKKVPPSTVTMFSTAGRESWRYWRLNSPSLRSRSERENLEIIETALRDAVRVRLECDVPLGAFLSGGIDSGLVTAYAARMSSRQLISFTVGFENSRNSTDERPLARLVSKQLGTAHEEDFVEANALNDLPNLLWLAGEPFADHSLVPTAAVCRSARRHVTVALTGDGGDELFAGYYRVVASAWGDMFLNCLGAPNLARLMTATQPLVGIPAFRRMRTALSFAQGSIADQFTNKAAVFSSAERLFLYNPLWEMKNTESSWRTKIDSMIAGYGPLQRADVYARLDYEITLPGRYLTKVDIASNACALECRSPFLDHELSQIAFDLPTLSKLPWGRQKGLLRKLASRELPIAVSRGRKLGFSANIDSWMRQDGSIWLTRLSPFHIGFDEGPLRQVHIQNLIKSHLSSAGNHGQKLWTLLCLELWWRMFVDQTMTSDFRI